VGNSVGPYVCRHGEGFEPLQSAREIPAEHVVSSTAMPAERTASSTFRCVSIAVGVDFDRALPRSELRPDNFIDYDAER
jgi:hypothetical protein